MGKEPSEIRQEIEETRTDMGDTVEALGYKADVKTRAKENVAGKRDRLKERITGATPDSDEVKQGARRVVGVAQENPIGLALGSVAVGFVAGLLVPSTRVEDEKLGPMADQVKETGQEALERGKQVAQEAAQSAKETVQEHGGEEAEKVRDSARAKVESADEGSP